MEKAGCCGAEAEEGFVQVTLADLKAEALAQVDQLRRERDEARASLQNLLADRGDILLVADSRLDAVLRQRDEATGTLEADLKRTRAMIEHLTAIIRAQDARERQRLVEVATRQREACARRANVAVDSDSLAEYLEGEVLATPLVTEGEK